MKDSRLEVLLTREKISERVGELADAISRDYAGKTPLLLCVLKGAIVFLADLIRNLRIEVHIDFILASSYEKHGSKGEVDLSPIFRTGVRGRDIIIVEDIIDTGITYHALVTYLVRREPASVTLCTLLDKPSHRRTELIRPDYVGFTVPDKFVVGYGLDYEERYRGLQDICVLLM